jgi:hypothetical protein
MAFEQMEVRVSPTPYGLKDSPGTMREKIDLWPREPSRRNTPGTAEYLDSINQDVKFVPRTAESVALRHRYVYETLGRLHDAASLLLMETSPSPANDHVVLIPTGKDVKDNDYYYNLGKRGMEVVECPELGHLQRLPAYLTINQEWRCEVAEAIFRELDPNRKRPSLKPDPAESGTDDSDDEATKYAPELAEATPGAVEKSGPPADVSPGRQRRSSTRASGPPDRLKPSTSTTAKTPSRATVPTPGGRSRKQRGARVRRGGAGRNDEEGATIVDTTGDGSGQDYGPGTYAVAGAGHGTSYVGSRTPPTQVFLPPRTPLWA